MSSLQGKVAFVTGAARGQGRSHAVELARAGADIIAVDICHDEDLASYHLATPEDLKETVAEVEALGRRIVASQTDTRDLTAMKTAFDQGVAELGGCDIVVANAGVAAINVPNPPDAAAFEFVLRTNVIGTWNTIHVAKDALIARGGGSIIITGSTSALRGNNPPGGAGEGYTASKHALVGLCRQFANTLAEFKVRVNIVHPTGVATDMILNDAWGRLFDAMPDLVKGMTNMIDIDMIQAKDVSNAVLFLASDEAQYITGIDLPVDAGYSHKR